MASPGEIDALRTYLGAGGASSFDDAFLGQCWDEAAALVAGFEGTRSLQVPAEIHALAIKGVASELFHRQAAPNGISQFADGSGNPVRVARDPMTAAYPILRPFVGLGIA